MKKYLITGIILPERAQVSFGHPVKVMFAQGLVDMTVSVINNQVAVWIDSPWPWDIHDLRNAVASHLMHQLAVLGFLVGHAYDLELTRIVASDGSVDYVYGIDIPCLAEKRRDKFSHEIYNRLLDKTTGPNGVHLNRCFTDLILAMKHPVDTAFYCYRAVEALRNHCGAVNGIVGKDPQWEKFRTVTGVMRDQIDPIKKQADGVRHGEILPITNDQRAALLIQTWEIVEKYIDILPAPAVP